MASISEKINRMFQVMLESSEFTSASPGHINHLMQVNTVENQDFEKDVEKIVKDLQKNETKSINDTTKLDPKTQRKVDGASEKLKILDKGNLADIKNMSTEQFGNVRQLATNPFGFMTRTILLKLRTGAGILFIVAIATEVAKFLILELFKPGRIFDIRFREQIDKQIIKFLDRKEQQELRQGFKSIITTTIGGLRGDSLRGQLGGNFYSGGQFGVQALAYDPSRVSPPTISSRDVRKKSFQDAGAAGARGRR